MINICLNFGYSGYSEIINFKNIKLIISLKLTIKIFLIVVFICKKNNSYLK